MLNQFTIAAKWHELEVKALDPIHAPLMQRLEMKKAFYAGFAQAINMVADISEAFREDQAAELLSRLVAEANDFGQNLKANNPATPFDWKQPNG